MELLLKENISSGQIPLSEQALAGSIYDGSVESLISRLRGLCDPVSPKQTQFSDHLALYYLRVSGGGQNRSSPAMTANPVVLRVRHSLNDSQAPWHVQHIGTELTEKSVHCLVRSVLESHVSSSIPKFLEELGFKVEHECIIKGHVFTKGRLKATVSKIYRKGQGGKETVEPLTGSHLVELTALVPKDRVEKQEEMKHFAEQLRPLVQLEKFDTSRIMQS